MQKQLYRIHCRFYRKYTIIIRLQQYWLSKANSFANSVCKHNCKHKCLCKCKHLSESKAAKAAWHNSIKVHCKAAIYCELQCAVVVQKGSSKRRAAEYCEPHSAGSNAVALAASPKVSNRLGSSRAITCLHTAAQAGPPPPPDPSPRRQRTVSGLHLLHLQERSLRLRTKPVQDCSHDGHRFAEWTDCRSAADVRRCSRPSSAGSKLSEEGTREVNRRQAASYGVAGASMGPRMRESAPSTECAFKKLLSRSLSCSVSASARARQAV